MKHPGNRPWFEEDQCGPWFIYYCEDDDGVDWYVCPDDEDKCEERPIAAGRAENVDAAMRQVADAVSALARGILAWAAAGTPGAGATP